MAKTRKPNPQQPKIKEKPPEYFVVELYDSNNSRWVAVDHTITLDLAQQNARRSHDMSGLTYRARDLRSN
jgi:hypothetical protein